MKMQTDTPRGLRKKQAEVAEQALQQVRTAAESSQPQSCGSLRQPYHSPPAPCNARLRLWLRDLAKIRVHGTTNGSRCRSSLLRYPSRAARPARGNVVQRR